MGMRIHKYLGYAIKGIEYDKDKWHYTDDRINPLGYLGSDYEDRGNFWTLDGYLRYCKHHLDQFNYHCEKYLFDIKSNFWAPHNNIIENMEYGIPGVLHFIPTGCQSFSRYDDSIDYYEHSFKFSDSRNNLEFLNEPIFPYIGYMDTRTGEILDNRAHDMWFYYKSFFEKRLSSKIQIAHEIAIELGFENLIEALKIIKPMIPPQLIALIRYLCIFNDDSTIWQLRPAIYTYWS